MPELSQISTAFFLSVVRVWEDVESSGRDEVRRREGKAPHEELFNGVGSFRYLAAHTS